METNTPWTDRKAIRPLGIIVVGGGIAGLAAGLGLGLTGHRVTILEREEGFDEVGAGIQLAPNAMRILERFGVSREVLSGVTTLSRISIRRYADNQEIGSFPLTPYAEMRYGSPSCVMHRADLQQVLLTAAKKAGCRVLTSQQVVRVDECFGPLVQTVDGTCYQGDLVLACDGLKSGIRREMEAALGVDFSLVPTGDAAYRILIPRERAQAKPHLLRLWDENVAIRCLGPQGHIMAYPVRRGAMYNIVLTHPFHKDAASRNGVVKQDPKTGAMEFVRAWSPLVRKLIACASPDEITDWNLYSNKPPQRWVLNRVALAGDASHGMLPYLSQGSAVGIEDVATLVAILTCTGDVDLALAVYEEARHQRSARIQAESNELLHVLHLADGEAQRARDKAVRQAARRSGASRGRWQCPDLLNDGEWQEYVWGVDVMEETLQGWHELVAKARAGAAFVAEDSL